MQQNRVELANTELCVQFLAYARPLTISQFLSLLFRHNVPLFSPTIMLKIMLTYQEIENNRDLLWDGILFNTETSYYSELR